MCYYNRVFVLFLNSKVKKESKISRKKNENLCEV